MVFVMGARVLFTAVKAAILPVPPVAIPMVDTVPVQVEEDAFTLVPEKFIAPTVEPASTEILFMASSTGMGLTVMLIVLLLALPQLPDVVILR
jgi:hypothetical protein